LSLSSEFKVAESWLRTDLFLAGLKRRSCELKLIRSSALIFIRTGLYSVVYGPFLCRKALLNATRYAHRFALIQASSATCHFARSIIPPALKLPSAIFPPFSLSSVHIFRNKNRFPVRTEPQRSRICSVASVMCQTTRYEATCCCLLDFRPIFSLSQSSGE
jgi:hypothetical protein